jgi:exonuclease SbcD
MKLLHAADLHIGFSVPGLPSAQYHALHELTEAAIDRKVDAVIWAGDTFHSRRPSPADLLVAVRAANRLRQAGVELFVGTGNHDGYTAIGNADSHTLGWWAALESALDDGRGEIHVMTEARVYRGGLAVAHLPYPHRRLVAGTELTPQEQVAEAGRIATRTVVDLAEQSADLLVAHVSFEGASLGSEAAMRMGWDAMLDPVVLEAFPYVALGHVHVQQEIAENAWYAGSLVPMGWGDTATGFLVVEDGTVAKVVPASSPSWLTAELDDWPGTFDGEVGPRSLVRVILRQSPDPRLARRVVDELRASGAAFVKVQFAPPEKERRQVVVDRLDVEDLIASWCRRNSVDDEAVPVMARDVVQHVRERRSG